MLNEEKTSCFDEILLAVSKFPEAEQNIFKLLARLLAVNPATSTTILTSVYSHLHGHRMDRERFSNPAINRQCLYRVAQKFVSLNENRNFNK